MRINFSKIKKISNFGIAPTIDLEVDHPDHNFYANGFVVSNSHGAAYASLSATTIYLKFKYPQQFFLSLLKLSRFEPDPISEISKIYPELSYFGIKLLPPSITSSSMDFKVEGKDIRFGLLSIKGVAEKSIEKIHGFQKSFVNKFEIFETANQNELNVGVLAAMIQAGTLDDHLTGTRSRTVLEAQLWNILTVKEKKACLSLGEKYKYDLLKLVKDLVGTTIKPSRFETIKKKYDPYKKIYEINSKNEDFANWWYEKKLLGFTYGKTLRDIFINECPDLETLDKISYKDKGDRCTMIGTVQEVYEGVSKEKKTKYLRLKLFDESGAMTVLIFSDKLEKHKEENGRKVEDGDIVVIRGQKMDDAIFAEWINIQSRKIYIKFSEMRAQEKKDQKNTERA